MNLDDMFKDVEYPFSRFLVLLSAVIAVVSGVFAVVILSEGTPDMLYIGTQAVPIPVIYYVLVTALLTILIILIKVRLYSGSPTGETSEPYTSGAETAVKGFKRSLTLLYIGVVIVMITIPFLALVAPPVWWLVGVTSFVSGINLSEIVIYFFSRKRG
jgi:NADH:ubiquinone oxidoreductase subunit 3 (subunit A)